ncbi:MAG: hypothetical protein SGILL_002054, partial [Bacillariaceae sp.]
MKSSSTIFAMAAVLLAFSCPSIAQKSLFIFRTPANVAIHFSTEETQFSTQDVHNIEQAATTYFEELITHDESLRFLDDPKNVLSVSVDMETQRIDENQIILNGNVQVMHYGDQ